jgi:2-hydroxychromene-2-carboxylate isomerase
LDLSRYASFLGVPLKASPKFYPQPLGGIEVSAQAIIRLQQYYGVGAPIVRSFSYEVQKCIWVTEEGDHCDIEVLRAIALRCGINESVISSSVVDKRTDRDDAGVREWNSNHKEAVKLGKPTSLCPRCTLTR